MKGIQIVNSKSQGRYVAAVYFLGAAEFAHILPTCAYRVNVERDERTDKLPAEWARLMATGVPHDTVKALHQLCTALFVGRHIEAIELIHPGQTQSHELHVFYRGSACPRWRSSLRHRHQRILAIIQDCIGPPS